MALSLGNYVHPPDVMQAAGFTYIDRNDITHCAICNLKVSDWTCEMDPFTVHSERSPHCAFVRSQQAANNFQISSDLKPFALIERIEERSAEQRSTKRQRTNSFFFEVKALEDARDRSFWYCPEPFRSRMIEAGFFSCNIGDRVICIYCDLICHQWNTEIDDPCDIHKTLSPTCAFVKWRLSHCDDSHSKVLVLPCHTDYIDPQRRQATFSSVPNNKFPSVEELVYAGFFYSKTKMICFYCNGLFDHREFNNHPIVEHVRRFPHCNYAKELSGEELYLKIQRSMRYVSNSEIVVSTTQHDRSTMPNEETLSRFVAARLDLPSSKTLLKDGKFKLSTIKQCLENQLRFKDDDFRSDCDLHVACMIHDKQIELIDVLKREIIIPSLKLQMNGRPSAWSRSISRLNTSPLGEKNQFFSMNDFQEYQNTRKILGNQFKEDIQVTKQRERSLINWPLNKPTRRDVIQGGWIIFDTHAKCPHCHMTYSNWKSDDHPFLIHQYVSPLCLFVLSSNPFHPNEIPIREAQEQYTDENIRNARKQPYNGLVASEHFNMSSIYNRLASFNGYPNGRPDNANELATAGFHYINYNTFMRCFYCRRIASMRNFNSQFGKFLKYHESFGRCHYSQQLHDCDPKPSIQKVSNKCAECMTNEKQLLTLPCRHCCLCKECGQSNYTCYICGKDVDAYVTVFLP